MEFRANQEKVEHNLTFEFYFVNLVNEVEFFFGVYNDGIHLTKDIQNPKAFRRWKRLNK